MLACTVRANLYHLLGVFASVYPEHMIKYSNKLLEVYVGALKAEVTLLLVFLLVIIFLVVICLCS